MGVLKLLCLAVFGALWGILWTAQDEEAHLVESIQEGELDMEQQVVGQAALGPSSFAIVYDDGTVTINDDGMRLIELSAEEAYNLLAVLFRNEYTLRQREDTVPLQELPEWAQPEEQAEQWQATATCQVDPTHTGRDVFRCDGCKRLACNQCGEGIDDAWLCERCLAQENVAYPF